MPEKKLEQTLVLIKPDALKNSLTGYVLSILSEIHTGLRFAGTKIVHVNRLLAEEHYAEHKGKPFFPGLINYIMGKSHNPDNPEKRRVIAIMYQGPGAVKKVREICGPTNPHEAREKNPGCIRSLGTIVPLKDAGGQVIGQRMDNLIHASATDLEAEREIKLWFKPNDIPPMMHPYPVCTASEHFYYLDHKLYAKAVAGGENLVAAGDIVWESDLAALQALSRGEKASCTLEAIAAKYLVNKPREY